MWKVGAVGTAEAYGSAGELIEFEQPDTDGEIGIGIETTGSCGCIGEVWAYLGLEERRELIKWLRANTPMEDENEQHAATSRSDAPGPARDEAAGPAVDARPAT